MPAIVTNGFRIYAAKKFIEGLGTAPPRSINSVYLFIGKTLPWSSDDAAGATDNTPPYPLDTLSGLASNWKNIIHLKKVNASDSTLVIRRFDWLKNTVYTQYDNDLDLFDPISGREPFYVFTEDLNVYKCISNRNGGPSYIKPTGSSTKIFKTGDGYLWKYMYTVSASDFQRFLTNEWVPVKTLLLSDNSRQWDVQKNSVDGGIHLINVINAGSGYVSIPAVTIAGDGTGATAVAEITNGRVTTVRITGEGVGYHHATATVTSGQITAITILDPGSGYLSAPIVTITGDGSAATATAVVTNGQVSAINITASGTGYTTATVNIAAGSGTQATAQATIALGVILKVVISPFGGHGSDPVSELGGFYAMVRSQLQFDENKHFSVANDFRSLGLLLNPFLNDGVTPATGTLYSQALEVTVKNPTGTFLVDNLVIGSVSGATGVVLDYDGTTHKLRIVNLEGNLVPGENVSVVGNSVSGLVEVTNGTAQAGGAFQITLKSADTAVNHFYETMTVKITSGPGVGQIRIIDTYDSTTKNAHITKDWTVTPTSSSHYSIADIKYPDLKRYTGSIMHVENRRPITRAAAQLEDIRPVAEF